VSANAKQTRSVLLGLVFLLLCGLGFQAKAYGPYISRGLYNIGRMTYYIDGQGAYCQNYAYDNRWRQLSRDEASELYDMNYTGVCGHP
jgi:hypothetical protein